MVHSEDDSLPAEGVPVVLSGDIVDTSWDIPPLSFSGVEPAPDGRHEDSSIFDSGMRVVASAPRTSIGGF